MQKQIGILLLALVLFSSIALAQANTTNTAIAVATDASGSSGAVNGPTLSGGTGTNFPTTACGGSADALEQKAIACKNAGKYYSRVASTQADSAGNVTACWDVSCTDKPACPIDAALENAAHACRDNKGTVSAYTDGYGCKQIACSTTLPTTVTPTTPAVTGVYCKKYSDEKGTHIVCSDGTQVNATSDSACTITNAHTEPAAVPSCSVTQEDNGCYVKKCSDGYIARSCPVTSPPIAAEPAKHETKATYCETGKDSEGNAYQKCDNGFYVNYADLKTYCEKTGTKMDPASPSDNFKCLYGDNGEYYTQVNSDGKRVECVINFVAGTEYCTNGEVRVQGTTSIATAVPIAGTDGDVVQAGTTVKTTTAPTTAVRTETALGNATDTPTTAPAATPSPGVINKLLSFFSSIFGKKQ